MNAAATAGTKEFNSFQQQVVTTIEM